MEFAIDKGLGAEPAKLGANGKVTGYKVAGFRLKGFLTAVCACGLILLVALGGYYQKAVVEQFKSLRATKKQTKSQSESIRLGMYLQAQLHQQHYSKEVEKTFLRINRFATRQFEDLQGKLKDTGALLSSDLSDAQAEVDRFITQELEDYRDDTTLMNEFTKVRQAKVSRMQEKALMQLLKGSSGDRLDSLAEMLEELFEDVRETPEVVLPPTVIPILDDLVEMLFGEEISFETGVDGWNDLVAKHNLKLPRPLQESIDEALASTSKVRSRDVLGDAIASVVEAARYSAGREETLKLADKWNQQKAHSGFGTSPDKQLSAEDSTVLVETAIAVQRLITAGKVPSEAFDFETLELGSFEDSDYDDDEEVPDPLEEDN